jgi:hypothetical protein
MNSVQKRFLMFLLGCIPARLLLVWLAKTLPKDKLPLLGGLLLFPLIGFTYIQFVSPRKTGLETQGGKIWWHHIRPVHIVLYALSAYLALMKDPRTYIALTIDVSFGLIAFLTYHYLEGNYSKLT